LNDVFGALYFVLKILEVVKNFLQLPI